MATSILTKLHREMEQGVINMKTLKRIVEMIYPLPIVVILMIGWGFLNMYVEAQL